MPYSSAAVGPSLRARAKNLLGQPSKKLLKLERPGADTSGMTIADVLILITIITRGRMGAPVAVALADGRVLEGAYRGAGERVIEVVAPGGWLLRCSPADVIAIAFDDATYSSGIGWKVYPAHLAGEPIAI